MHVLRGGLQEDGQQIVDFLLVDRVIVFQHHDEVAFEFVQLIDQAAGKHADRGQADGSQQRLRPLERTGKNRLNRRHKVGQEHAEVVDGFIQRQPGAGPLAGVQPGAHQDGLAVAGRRRQPGSRGDPGRG